MKRKRLPQNRVVTRLQLPVEDLRFLYVQLLDGVSERGHELRLRIYSALRKCDQDWITEVSDMGTEGWHKAITEVTEGYKS